MKILVCEKEEVLLTALEFRLRRQGYEIEQAANGKEALQKITEMSPDLAILGTEIEKISGLDLVRKIRREMDSQIPIILIAPLESEDEIIRGFELGINDFVTKPFKPVELVLRVRRIFET